MHFPLQDLCLIMLVILAWGFNFVAIKVGLQEMPPILLGALRFSLLLIPAIFIPFPKIKLSLLVTYGLSINFGQFIFLFSAIKLGMPAGLSSLVLQSQAFFTLILASVILNESFKLQNIVGLTIAVIGLIVIGTHLDTNVTLAGLIVTLCAALCWAVGNITIKKAHGVDMLSLTVWGGLIAIIPFWLVSLFFEGTSHIKNALIHINLITLLAISYLTLIATILGYALWGKMLAKYPASFIAPFSLLVPVIGLTSTAMILDETLTLAELIGSIIIMIGLCINVFGSRLIQFFNKNNFS